MTNLRKEKIQIFQPKYFAESGYFSGRRLSRKHISRNLFKIAAILAVVCFSTVNIFSIGSTFSYFTDSEESLNNTYEAGTLDFSISSPSDFAPELTPVQIATRAVTLTGSGTLGFLHSAKATDLTGDLCSSVNLTVTIGTQQVYQGLLTAFEYDAGTFSNTEEWLFQAAVPVADASLNGTCSFKLAFEAWQTNLADSSTGFYDKEELQSSLSYAYSVPVPPGPNVSEWNENFESYSLGLLSTVGSPKWQNSTGSFITDGYYSVTNVDKSEGSNGGFLDTDGATDYTSITFDPSQVISSGMFNFQVNVKQTNWAANSYFFMEFWAANGIDRLNFKFWPESSDQWSLKGGFNLVDCTTGNLISGPVDNQTIDATTLFSKDVWSTIKLQFDMDNHIVKIWGNNGTTDTASKCFWFDGVKSNETLKNLKVFGYASKTYFDNLKAN